MSLGSGTVLCAWQCFAVAIARFPAGNCRSPNQRQVVRDAVDEPGLVGFPLPRSIRPRSTRPNGPPLRTGLWCINCFFCVSPWCRESMPGGAHWAIRVTHHPSAGRQIAEPWPWPFGASGWRIRTNGLLRPNGLALGQTGDSRQVCAQFARDYAKWVVADNGIVTGVRHVIGCALRPIHGVLYAGADRGSFIIRRTES
jgi:hypothetical protein